MSSRGSTDFYGYFYFHFHVRHEGPVSDTLKDKPRGTGLGLPICKDIVRHCGGDIRVASRQGQGSAFAVALPGAPPLAGQAEARSAAAAND